MNIDIVKSDDLYILDIEIAQKCMYIFDGSIGKTIPDKLRSSSKSLIVYLPANTYAL